MSTPEDSIDQIDLQKSTGKTLLIPAKLHTKNNQHKIEALLDSGASGNFVDHQLINEYYLQKYPLKTIRYTLNADGSRNAAGKCSHYVKMKITINGKTMIIKPRIVSLGKHKLFLGISWLRKFNPDIDWQSPSLRWRNEDYPTLPLTHAFGIDTINQLDYEINLKTNTSQILAKKSDIKKESDPLKAVPKKYHPFLKVFNKQKSEQLPPRREWDHKIELTPDFKPKRMPVYSLTQLEQQELDKFIDENL